MKRTQVVLSTCLAIVACGSEPVERTPEPSSELSETHAPLMLRELVLKAPCYLPIVAIGECANQQCTDAREFNRSREEQVRALLGPYVEMADAIRDAPTAEAWSIRHTWPEPNLGATDIDVTADQRDPTAGAFRIYLHHHGEVASEGLPEEIDEYQTQFGLYTPNFTMIDLGAGTIRWTQWAIDISGGVYRGCDPETNISFDQRMNDDGVFDLFCWDQGGNRVSCEGANLWPIQKG